MSFFEIIIVAAAGIFLLWLWRGGGSSQPVAAVKGHGCATHRCATRRPLGCIGSLALLALAAGIVYVGQESHDKKVSIATLVAGGVLLLIVLTRSRRGFVFAGLVLALLAVAAYFGTLSVHRVVDRLDANGVELEEW